MANFVSPKYSNAKVKKAGKRIRDNEETTEDLQVLENFRACHAYVLNTFQANIRNHSRDKETGINRANSIGQRLKRRNTIVDKLRREGQMALSSMNDIAGCRIVFRDRQTLSLVRESMHNARWKHRLIHQKEKYDYIQSPKPSGYRGIHDVYEYKVNSNGGQPWVGKRVEIQYRTLPQHAWATAVEVADLVSATRVKFNEADDRRLLFFQLSSEIIARTAEGMRSCYPDMPDRDVVSEFRELEKTLGLLDTLEKLEKSKIEIKRFRKNTILVFWYESACGKPPLEMRTYKTVNKAIEAYNELEKTYGADADIVLVRGESQENIRDTFRNYFSDAHAFVEFVKTGISDLGAAK